MRRGERTIEIMKRLKALRRWFKRKFGYARLVCLMLLVGFAVLRVWDPHPLQEIRCVI
jgi:adenylate cyclase